MSSWPNGYRNRCNRCSNRMLGGPVAVHSTLSRWSWHLSVELILIGIQQALWQFTSSPNQFCDLIKSNTVERLEISIKFITHLTIIIGHFIWSKFFLCWFLFMFTFRIKCVFLCKKKLNATMNGRSLLKCVQLAKQVSFIIMDEHTHTHARTQRSFNRLYNAVVSLSLQCFVCGSFFERFKWISFNLKTQNKTKCVAFKIHHKEAKTRRNKQHK